jgi:4a-hydroxytetrahydrobiopterin dehydratase
MFCKAFLKEYTNPMSLSTQKCIPCELGGEPLNKDEVAFYIKDVPAWKVAGDNKKISRELKFKDFKEAMQFVNKVAELAESEGHHPDLHIHYNKVTLDLWTHEVGGLSVNDFIVAAKIDLLK